MPNVAIVVEVHPPATQSSDWVYHAFGAGILTISEGNTLVVPAGDDPQIMVTLVAGGGLDDTCVFADPPLIFTDSDNNIIDPPGWFQNLQILDSSIILFNDDNNNNVQTKGYFVKVQASYNEGAALTSPDPTIVNEGTGMFSSESQAEAPQVQAQSA